MWEFMGYAFVAILTVDYAAARLAFEKDKLHKHTWAERKDHGKDVDGTLH